MKRKHISLAAIARYDNLSLALHKAARGKFLAALPAVRAQVRYMDDIIWWADTLAQSRQILAQVRVYLHEHRELVLKNNIQIQTSQQGVSWCGFRITQGAIRLSRRRKKRFLQRRQYWEGLYLKGQIDAVQLQLAYASVQAITDHTDSLVWRRENLQRHPALEV